MNGLREEKEMDTDYIPTPEEALVVQDVDDEACWSIIRVVLAEAVLLPWDESKTVYVGNSISELPLLYRTSNLLTMRGWNVAVTREGRHPIIKMYAPGRLGWIAARGWAFPLAVLSFIGYTVLIFSGIVVADTSIKTVAMAVFLLWHTFRTSIKLEEWVKRRKGE